MFTHIIMTLSISNKVLDEATKLFNVITSVSDLYNTLKKIKGGPTNPDLLLERILAKKVLFEYVVSTPSGQDKSFYSSRNNASIFEIAIKLYGNAYFCNLTSICYHGLTNQIPNVVYIAKEGKGRRIDIPKKSKTILTNEQIFQAFIKPSRVTNEKYYFKDSCINLIERVDRNKSGVIAVNKSNSFLSKGSYVSSLERALIDACVSPQYNGGILSVVDYFRNAKHVDSAKLIDIYNSLHFIYPYWQAIGFICDEAGLATVADKIYSSFKSENEFYIDHNAKTSWELSEKWQLWHPKEI